MGDRVGRLIESIAQRVRACGRLPPVLQNFLGLGPGPQGPPQQLGQAVKPVDFRGGVAGLLLQVPAAPVIGVDVIEGRAPMAALLNDHHAAAAGLGTDGGQGSKGHDSGLAEGVNGGAAQAGHEVGHLDGQGLPLQRPQQGGGGGRRQGGHDRVAGGVD